MLIAAAPIMAGGESHGGDPSPRARMKEAKEQGALILLQLDPAQLDPNLPANVRDWIEKNRVEWATDVASSPHNWPENDAADKKLIAERPDHLKNRAAITTRDKKAAIDFSSSIVEKKAPDVERALQVVWHESCHHLNEVDETFIDSLVDAVYQSWRVKVFGPRQPAAAGPVPTPGATFNAEALALCDSMLFAADKNQCLANIKFGKFDSAAIKICARFKGHFASDINRCLLTIKDVKFDDKNALASCNKYNYSNDIIECLRIVGIKPPPPPGSEPVPQVVYGGWWKANSGTHYGDAALKQSKGVIRNYAFQTCEKNNKTTQYHDRDWEINNCSVSDDVVGGGLGLDINTFFNAPVPNNLRFVQRPNVVQRSASCDNVWYRCSWVQYVQKGR